MIKKRILTIAMCMGIFVTMLDTTIMNIALPSINTSLNTTLGSISWSLNAYTIVFAALTIPLGKLANIFGKKLFYILGLLFFATGSLISGISTTLLFLITGRIVQSIGASILFPLSMDLAISSQEVKQRGKAALIIGITQGGASALGPVLGGVITQFLGWRYIFLINIPIIFISFLFSLYALPNNMVRENSKVDWLGTVTAISALASLTLIIIQFNKWKVMLNIVFFAIFIFSAILFFIFEKKSDSPMINLELFKNSSFSIASIGTILSQFFLVGFMVITPTFLTTIYKKSELSASFLVTPTSLLIFLIAPFAGKAVKQINSKNLLSFGFLLMGFGYLLLSHLLLPFNYLVYLVGGVLLGIGYGVVVGPISILSTEGLTGSLLTTTQSMMGVLRQIGSILSVAIFISSLTTNMSQSQTQFDYIKSFTNLFLFASPVVFIASFMFYFIYKKKGV